MSEDTTLEEAIAEEHYEELMEDEHRAEYLTALVRLILHKMMPR